MSIDVSVQDEIAEVQQSAVDAIRESPGDVFSIHSADCEMGGCLGEQLYGHELNAMFREIWDGAMSEASDYSSGHVLTDDIMRDHLACARAKPRLMDLCRKFKCERDEARAEVESLRKGSD